MALNVDDAMMHRAFGTQTLLRGTRYASTGHVLETSMDVESPDVENSVLVLHGSVAGTSRYPYEVDIEIDGRHISSWCTCPVGNECKHAVAVLAVLRSAASRVPVVARPAWQKALDAMVESLDEAAPVPMERRKVAIRFELPPARRRMWKTGSDEKLWLRPVRAAAHGKWAKTGISWRNAEQPQYDLDHDQEQLVALGRFARGFGGGAPRDLLDLTRIGPGFLDWIQQAQQVGVAVVGGERISTVDVSAEPLEAVLDVVETPRGSQLRLGVWHEGEFLSGEEIHLLGHRPHTVGMVRPVRAGTTAAQPKVNLLLAPLASLVPEALVGLHRDQGPLDVPREAVADFEKSYLPRLRRRVAISSSDGSLRLAPEVPAVPQLLIAWAGIDVTLTWQWRNPDGSTHPLGGERDFGLRRGGPERDLLPGLKQFTHLQPGCALTGLAAMEFVVTDLPRLREVPGLEVLTTGDEPGYRDAVGEAVIEFVATEGPDDTEGTDWFDLAVVITVEGESVPIADVLAALTLEEPKLLLASGLVISTDRPEFHRLAELVAAAAEIRTSDSGAMRVAHRDLGIWNDLADLGVVDAEAAAWVQAAQALIGHETLPEVTPVGLASTLREYQHEGVRWLVHLWSLGLGGILADDMGLGKTVQTLALISHARAQGADPFLVVAPTSVMSAWVSEAARHTPGLKVCVIDATRARRGGTELADAIAAADLVVTSYTLFRLEAEGYAEQAWGGLVLDEAQSLKNHQSKTYQAVRDLPAPFRLAVTGTPFENRLMELWSLLSVVAPGLYPSAKRFGEQVARPVEKHGDQAAMDRFRSRIRPFILRRTKELVAADLPAKQEQVLEVALTPAHQKIYDTWLQRERQAILGLVDDFDRNRVAIFSALTRLRQLSLDAALVDEAYEEVGSAKLDMLIEHLVELAAEGHRALVFSQFTSFLKRARARLEAEGLTSRYLDGSTRRRGDEIEAFKAGDGDAFLISLKAGGVGLTLTEADYVFVLDPWWNPAAEAQAVDRAHRIGQQRSVMVYRLVSRGTIEEKVMALKARKAELFASVFSGDGAVGTGIEAADVRALLE